jgi:phage baseplate assembly protein gpV
MVIILKYGYWSRVAASLAGKRAEKRAPMIGEQLRVFLPHVITACYYYMIF